MLLWLCEVFDLFKEFELDSDELEDQGDTLRIHGRNEQTMPLLVGLMDAATVRRSLDSSLPLDGLGDSDDIVNIEDLAAKRIAGGGMIDSVANMANSILGAGNVARLFDQSVVLTASRNHW